MNLDYVVQRQNIIFLLLPRRMAFERAVEQVCLEHSCRVLLLYKPIVVVALVFAALRISLQTFPAPLVHGRMIEVGHVSDLVREDLLVEVLPEVLAGPLVELA